MADIMSPEKRSWNMSRIHSKDTKIELKLRHCLWHRGIRYRKNYNKLPGKPDIAITKYKIAIFCDSAFFHGKDWEKLRERIERGNNSSFWMKKISRNIDRDDEVNKKLLFEGWTVLRFWDEDIKKHVDDCVKAVEETIFEKEIDADFDQFSDLDE